MAARSLGFGGRGDRSGPGPPGFRRRLAGRPPWLLAQRSARPVDAPLARHEALVLDVITQRTADGPLPAHALFTRTLPSVDVWHNTVAAEAFDQQWPHRRLINMLCAVAVLFGLAYSLTSSPA
ncbi:hypothetical protein CC117_13635 [Parafrankia colletiae]|uniref:Uncharacterized protein n=1 Tax=Parafrankia colletiae TaxID=573497 RepID=A0A1S1R2S0_9ACTN|nr:hypothetical protein [Parafrankia colletiae]MCK9904879.1 hypothetical protein [Frankia sp. Cpl3]OHV40217.1 hypothetical protein CC117_13635 [Parafrankia colletiae]